MRIGIDFRPALSKNSRNRGIGRYTRLLVEALARSADFEGVLYTFRSSEAPVIEGFTASGLRQGDHPRVNWIHDLVFLNRRLQADGIDLYHATDILSIPTTRRLRVIATVHDLIPFLFWAETVRAIPKDFAWCLRTARKRLPKLDRIVTISQHSQKDICETLNIPQERVQVIYPAGPEFSQMDREEARDVLVRLYNLHCPFLLYVGGNDFRKNLHRLIKAFHRFRERGFPGDLALVGECFRMDIPETRRILELADSLHVLKHLRLPGLISDEHLVAFYSACDIFVFPSLYEGFGLPVLEAMQCGAPVAVGNVASLPEVTGDAGEYFDPEEIDSIVDALARVWGSDSRRQALRERGFVQAAKFSWQRAASEFIDLYADTCAGHRT